MKVRFLGYQEPIGDEPWFTVGGEYEVVRQRAKTIWCMCDEKYRWEYDIIDDTPDPMFDGEYEVIER